jgi:hypothetical protein
MLSWFKSFNGAVTLSVIALVAFSGYAVLVFRYVIGELATGLNASAAATVVVMLLVGGWVWALIAASGGRRGGLIAVLVFCALAAFFTLYDLLLHSPVPYGWPLVQISIWVTFVTSVIAIVLIALQLKG